MKAWMLNAINDIRFQEKELPKAKPGEVLLCVKAAGICGSDIPRVFETGAHNMPLVPGHEFSGIVEETGDGVDEGLIGKRASVFPLIPCKNCGPCKDGRYEMCRNYDYVGSRRDGAFAEYVTFPAENLMIIPDNVTYEQAAMSEPMAVAVHAMKIGTENLSTDKKKSVAVCGLGTIGLLLIMFLKDAGYENIYAIGNKDIQKEKCKELGVPEECFINSRSENVPESLKEKTADGTEIFFECIGRNESVNYAIESAAPAGHVVFVGNPYSDMNIPKDIYWKILRNQLTVRGTWNSSFTFGDGTEKNDDWLYVMKRISEGGVHPEKLITHNLPLPELMAGLKVMKDKTDYYCKVMIKNDKVNS